MTLVQPGRETAIINPLLSHTAEVTADQIDINDHLNARFYGLIIYEGNANFSDHIGFDETLVAERRQSKVVVESHMRYERELMLGDRMGVRSWLVGVDDKRLHFVHELLNLDKGYRAALREQIDLYFDLELRRVAIMPRDMRERLDAAVADITERPGPTVLKLPSI